MVNEVQRCLILTREIQGMVALSLLAHITVQVMTVMMMMIMMTQHVMS